MVVETQSFSCSLLFRSPLPGDFFHGPTPGSGDLARVCVTLTSAVGIHCVVEFS